MNPKTDYSLSKYWDLCYRAHSNVSFSPERRADSYVKEFSQQLDEDLQNLGENQGNYREKYEKYFSAWMQAKSNCLSSMITGPSNFPVRRAEKANRSERNRSDEFAHWREKYFRAVNRERTLSPEEELEGLYDKLDKLTIQNELVKDFNKLARKYKAGKVNEVDFFDQLNTFEFSERTVSSIKMHISEPWFKGVGSYAKAIREANERIHIMKVRINRKDTWEDIKFEGGYITIEDDRVKIFHEDRPEKDVIEKLKRTGFRWSPNWKSWVRKHTGNAVADAKRICCTKEMA